MSSERSKAHHTTLILDISSGSVSAGLVGARKDSLPEIIYKNRMDFSVQDSLESSTSRSAMLQALKSVLERTFVEGLPHQRKHSLPNTIDHAVVSLSAPWCQLVMRERKIVSERSFQYDERFAKRLAHSEEETLTTELNRERGGKDIFEVFSSSIISLRLNGYKTAISSKKKVTNLEMQIAASYAKRELLISIEEVIGRTLGLKHGISFQNFSYILKTAVSNLARANSFTLLEFTEESSNLLSVENGDIKSSAVLPFGSDTIARAIAREFDEPLALSRSRLSIYSRGEFDEEGMAKIDEVLGGEEEKWDSLYKALPKQFSSGNILLSSRREFSLIAEALLKSGAPGARVSLLGKHGYDLHIAKDNGAVKDEKLGYIAAFSASLLNTK